MWGWALLGLRSVEEYLASLRDGREVYYRGSRVDDVTSHEVLGAAVRHASEIYRLQFDPAYRDLLTYEDPKLGRVSRFYKIPRGPEDLVERFKLIYETTRLGRGMFNIIKAIGSDALFALLIISKRVDEALGTSYHERVTRYYEMVASKDLALAVAQTDVKGDRSRRPHQQDDPDMYLRIVERTKDGIYVQGAKAHTTQSIAANEIIVLPTRAMTENDRDYAVAFAVPANARGLKLVSRPMKAVESALRDPWFVMGRMNVENETLTIFDNVFVPWERVFLAGEWRFAGPLAVTFPMYHRFTAIAYRAAMADLLVGLAKLIAEYNGVDDKPHIRRDIVNIIRYKETLRATAIAAAYTCQVDPATGIAVPNVVMTNVGKLHANEEYVNAVKNLVDVAGGLAATLPSPQDFENPSLKPYLEKYLKARGPALERARLLALVRELISSFGALFTVAMIHAEGSIEASVIELYRSYNYEDSKKLALYAAGIRESF